MPAYTFAMAIALAVLPTATFAAAAMTDVSAQRFEVGPAASDLIPTGGPNAADPHLAKKNYAGNCALPASIEKSSASRVRGIADDTAIPAGSAR